MIARSSESCRNVLDEGFVYFEPLDRQLLEVIERRIAGPEIVDRDMHSHLPQFPELRGAPLDIAHGRAFGHLEVEAAGRQSCFRRGPTDTIFDEVRALELARRKVHGNTETNPVPPPSMRRACAQTVLSTHSSIAVMNPVSSASGMKSVGSRRPRLRVVPSDQRLGIGYFFRLDVDLGLIHGPTVPRARSSGAASFRASSARWI